MCRKKREITDFCIDSAKDSKKEYQKVVQNYINYYHRRAKNSKRMFYLLNIIKIAALGAIPFFEVLLNHIMGDRGVAYPWLIALLSAIGLILEAVISFTGVREKWRRYRATDNMLLVEQRKYFCLGEKEDESWKAYVTKIESIIGDEAVEWNEKMQQKQDGQKIPEANL